MSPDYNYTVTVPTNTSRDSPVIVECVLTRGVLMGGELFFPQGCHALVHVVICDGSGQLYPANAEDTFHGDGVVIPLVGRYKLDTAPYKLYIRAWSPGTIYEHNPQMVFHVLTEEEVTPWFILKDLLAVFKRLLGL